MTAEVNFVKQALACAGVVGKVQGLLEFIKKHPNYYSADNIATLLNKYIDEMNDKMEELVNQ